MQSDDLRLPFGQETEYAVMGNVNPTRDREPWVRGLWSFLAKQTRAVNDCRSQGLYLTFGRAYLDSGCHPEFATMPVDNPWDLLLCQRCFEGLAVDYARRSGNTLFLVRSNIDYLSPARGVWGSHDNIQVGVTQAKAVGRRLVPYLATRCLFTGAGGFHVNARTHAGTFTLSPRSWTHQASNLYGFKPLSRGTHLRFHVTCGENLMTDIGLVMKVVVLALLVRLAEKVGPALDDLPRLKDPVACMQRTSDRWWRTQSCPVTLMDDSRVEALEVQRRYYELLRCYQDAPFLPPWTGFVLDLWQDLFDDFLSGPVSPRMKLDWMIKQEYFNTYLEQWYGIQLASLPQAHLPPEAYYNLYKLDYDFGRLTNESYATQLLRAGTLAGLPFLPKLPRDYHPMQGVAGERAAAIRDCARGPGEMACLEWGSIVDRQTHRVVRRLPSEVPETPAFTTAGILQQLDRYLP